MNEYTHPGDVLASPAPRIQEADSESRTDGTRPRGRGRHRVAGSGRRAAGFRPLRGIAVIASAAAVAAAAFAVGTHHGSPAGPAAAQAAVAVPQLTKADIRQLKHMTPAEAAHLTDELDAAYGKFGVHIGVGPSGAPALPDGATQPAAAGKATLTSYQWAAGIQWDHVWVTASYADLQPIANNTSVVVSTATYFCNKLKGGIAFACYAVGNLISYLLGKVHVTNWSSSHGVWGADYWFPYGHSTGGFW